MVFGAAETLPFLLTGLHCNGDEDKISDCYKETQICYSNQRAGVLCYNTTGIVALLVIRLVRILETYFSQFLVFICDKNISILFSHCIYCVF